MIATQATKPVQQGNPHQAQSPALPTNGVLHELNAEVRAVVADGLTAIDKEVFAVCWQRMGGFRDLMLLAIAQEVRHQYRGALDQAELDGRFSIDVQNKTLEALLNNVMDFSFALLSDRQIMILSNALSLAFEADLDVNEFEVVLTEAGRASSHTSDSRMASLATGLSGKFESLSLPDAAKADAAEMPSASVMPRLLSEMASIVSGGPGMVDKHTFAAIWQRIGPLRDLMLMVLAQEARNQYRTAIAGMGADQQASAPARARVLEPLMQHVTDFAFEMLSNRQIVVLSSSLALAFEPDMESQDLAWTLGNTAVASDFTSPGRVEAMVIGVAGQYKFDIEPIHSLSDLDSSIDVARA